MTIPATQTPVAYITLGGAGSGKSTLSKRLSALTGAVYLDKDTIAGPLVQLALAAYGQDPFDREANTLYLQKIMPVEYETLFAAAGRNLELGHSVVLDAPFVAYLDDPLFLQNFTAQAAWPSARIRILHVRAHPDVVRQRLIERANERDRVKLADWDAYWQRFGALHCEWRGGEHTVFNNDDDSAFARLESFVDAPEPVGAA